MSENGGRKIKWGVMGAGRINRRFIPGLLGSSNGELTAIASREKSKAESLASQYGALRAYDNYEAILDDLEIEAVYLPLPNTLHVEWAIKAAAAGKHVLSEKPLAVDPGDIIELEQVAHQAKVLVMEAFMWRFHPQHARVKELIGSGAIGDMRAIRATNSFVLNPSEYNIRLDENLGGGATWDVGCYSVNAARFIFDEEPLEVIAQGTFPPGSGVELSAAAIMEFKGGKRAILDFGFEYGRRSFYEVMGNKGTVSVENMWQEANEPAFIYLRNEKGLQVEEFAPVDHFTLQVEAFNRAILEGKPAPYSLLDARYNARACLAIIESLKEGRRVILPEEEVIN